MRSAVKTIGFTRRFRARRFLLSFALSATALLACAIAFTPAQAHDPNLSTHFLNAAMDADGKPRSWSLNLNFGQAGLLAALEKKYGKENLAGLSADELENTSVAYLRDTIRFEARAEGKQGRAIDLHFTGAVVSGHHSLFRFELVGVPPETDEFFVSIRAGAEKRNHTHLLRVNAGEFSERFILNAAGDWQTRVDLKPEAPPWPNWLKVLISMAGALGLVLLLGLMRGGKSKGGSAKAPANVPT